MESYIDRIVTHLLLCRHLGFAHVDASKITSILDVTGYASSFSAITIHIPVKH